jgi:hypothetical protein
MPHKTFTAASVLTASDVNTYLMDQGVMTFTTASARNTALPTPDEGMLTFQEDVDRFTWYNGSTWVTLNPFTTTDDSLGLGSELASSSPAYILDIREDAGGIESADNRLHFPYTSASSLVPSLAPNTTALLLHNADSGDVALVLRTGTVDWAVFIDDSVGENLVIASDSGVAMEINDTTLNAEFANGSVTAQGFLPYQDDLYDLGSASLRFDDVYATNATIQTSDLRYKDDVEPLNVGLEFVRRLQPLEYRRPGKPKKKYWGFGYQHLAADIGTGYAVTVEATTPEAAHGMRSEELIAPLVKAVQQLADRVDALEQRLGQTT